MITKKSLLKEWLIYIQTLNPISIDLTLDRIRFVAKILNLLPLNIYTVLIGGTNGKGTTCCLLENILLNNNIKVGLYTSPHLLSYNERIRVCGKVLPDDIHIQVMSIIDNARGNTPLTYFEFITLSAFYIFKHFKLDVVILEVGLGGRLDATNIIDPNISAITNIAIDHVDFLGNTRDKIAIEKSGIFRSNRPAIIGDIHRPNIIDEISKSQGSILFARGRDWDFYYYKSQWVWTNYYNNSKTLYNLPLPMIPIENAAVVLSILFWMPCSVSKKSIFYGLKHTNLAGRFQIINYNPLMILDVGHNPHAAAYVIKQLSSLMVMKISIIRIVIGMLKHKDIKNTIHCLSNMINVCWYCSNLDTPLSANIEELSYYLVNFNVQYFDNIINAWKQAVVDSNFGDCILVFGSFYAVGPIVKFIINNNNNDFFTKNPQGRNIFI